ncbi:hypothetical protein QWZ16_16100 [Vibrio ostreicida]|uniref:Uncharacterized protein n=1 Tax=Vibrio ostreicida TaxID=526588 RepID=A0ABT8BW13_9VIBR|nr:hypothetical protein [Vibrio ostreicida]MDN3611163.1 hypothetical protein [Vibrio ostreicida]
MLLIPVLLNQGASFEAFFTTFTVANLASFSALAAEETLTIYIMILSPQSGAPALKLKSL